MDLKQTKIIVNTDFITENGDALIFGKNKSYLIIDKERYTLYEENENKNKKQLYQFLFFDKLVCNYKTTIPIPSLDYIFNGKDSMVDQNDGKTYYKSDYVLINELMFDDEMHNYNDNIDTDTDTED